MLGCGGDHLWSGRNAVTGDNGGLHAVVRRIRCLVLDFNGCVCDLYAGHHADQVIERMRQPLAARGIALAPDLTVTPDPVALLRFVAALRDAPLLAQVTAMLDEEEAQAVATAAANPGLPVLLDAARATGRRLAIVSNHSTPAVTGYLRRHDLLDRFEQVVTRSVDQDPDWLKPSTYPLWLALTPMWARPATTALVGDMVSDMQAAGDIPCNAIGLARRPDAPVALRGAGADAVVDSLDELATALYAHLPADTQVAQPGRVDLRGGIRVVPKTGGGWRHDGSAFSARLIADRDIITIATMTGDSLIVTRRNLDLISGWRFGPWRGVLFETNDCDDRWIFRTMNPRGVFDCLRDLGWPIKA
jgi:phosphoglycolate phosphatase-like HAD superfamily hydrolase